MPELFIGIIIALFVYERAGCSPGGIITAGFVALYSGRVEFVLCTLLAAGATAFAMRIFSRFAALYGKRLFALCVLTGMVLSSALSSFFAVYGQGGDFAVIGHVLPGLLAKDIFSQGAGRTLTALALAVGATRLAVFAGRGWLW